MATQTPDGTYPGLFTFAPETVAPGHLTLAGPNTSFFAWSDNTSIYRGDYRNVVGELYDTRKVTLLDCQDQPSGQGLLSPGGFAAGGYNARGRATRVNYSVELNPSYVLFGDYHLLPSEAVVTQMHFVPGDAGALFSDEHVIGFVRGKTESAKIAKLVQTIMCGAGKLSPDELTTKVHAAEVNFGMVRRKPFIFANTALGEIRAWHSLESIGETNQRTLRNEIIITLKFKEPLTFGRAMRRSKRLLEFFNVVAGRPQILKRLVVDTSKRRTSLDVYVFPETETRSRLGPGDVLVDGVKRPKECERMLVNWLSRDELWNEARARIATYAQQRTDFRVDSVVGIANAFDVLDLEYPPAERNQEVTDAIGKCRVVFQNGAPEALERAMNALGRMHMRSLKDKVKFRARILIDRIGDKVPNIDTAIDGAINYRNYLLHGRGNDVGRQTARFFADTLEFIFLGSDLVEAGWDVSQWCAGGVRSSHPFAAYVQGYARGLSRMKGGG